MENSNQQGNEQTRYPRLLWACPYSLLDTSSGASLAVRELLSYLKFIGWEIYILSCTIFDTKAGLLRIKQHQKMLNENVGKIVDITDDNLIHHVIPVKNINRYEMTTREEDVFYGTYVNILDKFKPDIVYTYGGHTLELVLTNEAIDRGIPMAAYLANGNYMATRWCRDLDIIITDSQATSDMYFEKQGFRAIPIGAPINTTNKKSDVHERKHVLFVNPSLAKGAAIVAEIALLLEDRRPDIIFEVLESRGSWREVLQLVSKTFGKPRKSLKNVIVTQHTTDMRSVYSRARILLAPSLWWESFGMVAGEAMLNGIPALVTKRGGLPEVIGGGGIALEFPAECYESPYKTMVKPELLEPLAQAIEHFFDDEAYYQSYVSKAYAESGRYATEVVGQRFINAVASLVLKGAGNRDINERIFPNKQVIIK